MSGLVAVFGNAVSIDDSVLRRMHGCISTLGGERTDRWRGRGAWLATSSAAWEAELSPSDPCQVARDDGVFCVAVASLYYQSTLLDKLRQHSVQPVGNSPAELVLAAYRTWGTDCAAQLEGDFAFVLWDSTTQTVLCARDFAGMRPLFFAEIAGGLVVASNVAAVLAHPACPHDINLASVGSAAAGMLWSAGSDTCYQAITPVQMASAMVWRPDQAARMWRYWEPPAVGTSRLSFPDAADELRGLLEAAVRERMAPSGPTSVWMSGGWDSTAVFGCGMSSLDQDNSQRALLPVSISYPPGDPGREDELINLVASHWKVPVHWLDIADIPLFEDVEGRASRRDEPVAHLYENWNRALARGTRRIGARVV